MVKSLTMWTPSGWPWLFRIWTVCVRCSAVLCPIIFLYLAIGSFMFPEWYYPLLWARLYADSAWWKAGLDFWLTDQPFWFYVGTTAAAVLLVLGYRQRGKVLSFIDRFAFRMIAWSMAGALITVLAVRIYGAPCLPAGQLYAMAYELTLKEVKLAASNPTI